MSDEQLMSLFTEAPTGCARAILIFPRDAKTAITWYGMTAAQVAETLYAMADEVVDQRLPPPDWRERIK